MDALNMNETTDLHQRLYGSLYRIRRVEEEIARIYPTDKIKSPVHLSIGQESVSVGVCDVVRREDIVFGTYRSHAVYLAKGGNLRKMMAELYGKKTGCARGKAGSMHLVDIDVGMMGTSAIVATSIPQAVGYALALKMRREPLRHPFSCKGSNGRRRFMSACGNPWHCRNTHSRWRYLPNSRGGASGRRVNA